MATSHHRRQPAHPKKPPPAHARPARPLHISRRSNGPAPSKDKQRREQLKEDDDEAMATSFLQYCATCEKQIIVPSNSVLYCSESCRRKDSNKVLESPPRTPYASSFPTDDDPSGPDIVPRRSPRAPNFHRLSLGPSESSDDESAQSRRPGQIRQSSEAAHYLRQFHSNPSQQYSSTRTSRPRLAQPAASNPNTSTAPPSLSHSPASTSTASFSVPYTPSTRPLPPRTGTAYGSFWYGSRSLDLVLPFVPPAPSTASASFSHSFKTFAEPHTFTGNAEGELRYEKRRTFPSAISASPGSLRQLFGSESSFTFSNPGNIVSDDSHEDRGSG